MVKQYKVDKVENLIEKLNDKNNFIFTNYSGVKVQNLSLLRKNLRDKEADFKVVKNNLFQRALEKLGYENFEDFLKGPIGVTFFKDNIGEVAKVLKDFSKDEKNFSYSVGFYDKVLYDEEKIKKVSDLPPLESILAQIMSLLNASTSSMAMGVNQIMSSLARGIKAVAEANEAIK